MTSSDWAGLVAKIHAALDAKAVTPDDAANLIALIEGTLASRHNNWYRAIERSAWARWAKRVFQETVPQVQFKRGLLANPVYNYAALQARGADAKRLLRMGWTEVSRFDEIIVLKRLR